MEYMILDLPFSKTSIEELINEFAQQGWRIICSVAEYRLILGREI